MERCLKCQYYDRNQRGGEAKAGSAGSAGQCRRSGPALSPLNQKTYMIEGVWPTVRDDDWCGEWKALQRRVEGSRIGELLSTPLATPVPPPTAFPAPVPRVNVQAARAALQIFGSEAGRHPTAPPTPIAPLPFSGVGKSTLD